MKQFSSEVAPFLEWKESNSLDVLTFPVGVPVRQLKDSGDGAVFVPLDIGVLALKARVRETEATRKTIPE